MRRAPSARARSASVASCPLMRAAIGPDVLGAATATPAARADRETQSRAETRARRQVGALMRKGKLACRGMMADIPGAPMIVRATRPAALVVACLSAFALHAAD